jgi:hypothetical protein
MEDGADFALAMANSIRDAERLERECAELSRAVEESHQCAIRRLQEMDDANLASDLAAIDCLEKSRARERMEKMNHEDTKLASVQGN